MTGSTSNWNLEQDGPRKGAHVHFEACRSDPETVRRIYRIALDWFKKLGLAPNTMQVFGTKLHSKPTKFHLAHAKLEKIGFEGMEGFFIHCEEPDTGEKRPPRFATFSYWSGRNSHVGFFARGLFCDMREEAMYTTVGALIECARPQYGYGGWDEVSLDDFVDSMPQIDAHQVPHDWSIGESRGLWNYGFVGGWLWSFTFLPDGALSASIDGMSLREWICAAPDRGTLYPQAQGLTLWFVPTELRKPVFLKLWDSGLIFKFEEDWPRIEALAEPQWAKKKVAL
ncbi:MAG: hypothetical protein JO002_01545, partial [Burkholderiaceae bacterium]|nr:hypothetical protein [Burkholderiaceae bacterium]